MLLSVLAVCTEEELGPEGDGQEDAAAQSVSEIALTPSELAARREQIKAKIRTIGKMQRVFQLLRYVFTGASA
jgi:serine/threonine-protein phosphatase 2B catalytic subunit